MTFRARLETAVRWDRWYSILDNPSPLVKQAPTAVALAAAVFIVLILPELSASRTGAALAGAIIVFAATLYAAGLSARRHFSGIAVLIIPMVDILGIGLFRAGTGGPQSMFTSLVILPVVWLAAARGVRYVFVVAGLTSAALLLPYLVEPQSRSVELLRGVISPLVFACVAAIINETSRQLRMRADQAEQLVQERDRTLRENAELINSLRESEGRYRDLLGSFESLWASITAQAVIATDRGGIVVAWNPGAEKLFGQTEDEVLRTLRVDALFPAKALDDLVADSELERDCEAGAGVLVPENPDRQQSGSEEELAPGLRALFASADREKPMDGDLTMIAAGGLLLPARVTVTHRQGAEQGYLFVVSDETRAAEVARLKDEFVGMISHELRTPLSSILGFLDLLQNDPSEPLTTDQLRLVGIIDRNARRLLALVGDLLFTARAESEGFELVRSEMDVRELVTSAVASASPSARSKRIELTTHVPPDPVPLDVDGGRLGQALDNLLSNAIKFTPPGGRVLATVQRIDGAVVVSIEDTGIGIPEAEHRLLFTRFFRASTATANAVPGVGLGLVITRMIVKAHGGSLELSSEEGKGTEFKMIFPVSEQIPHAQ